MVLIHQDESRDTRGPLSGVKSLKRGAVQWLLRDKDQAIKAVLCCLTATLPRCVYRLVPRPWRAHSLCECQSGLWHGSSCRGLNDGGCWRWHFHPAAGMRARAHRDEELHPLTQPPCRGPTQPLQNFIHPLRSLSSPFKPGLPSSLGTHSQVWMASWCRADLLFRRWSLTHSMHFHAAGWKKKTLIH